jgi:hypothetical protein
MGMKRYFRERSNYMETHVALSSGVLTAMVDQQSSGAQSTTRTLENVEHKPNTQGSATYTAQNFDRTALLTPVVGRGTLFDLLM